MLEEKIPLLVKARDLKILRKVEKSHKIERFLVLRVRRFFKLEVSFQETKVSRKGTYRRSKDPLQNLVTEDL